MNIYKSQEKAKLTGYIDYLTNVAHLSESTANDYCKRLLTICYEEGIDVEDLSDNIETLYSEYTTGSKKDKGARSHNSYRGAITQFRNYLSWSHSQQLFADGEKYLLQFSSAKVKEQRIGVATLTDTSTNQTISVRSFIKDQVSDLQKLMKIVWEMTYDAVIKEKGVEGIYDILKSLSFGLEIEDGVTKAVNILF